MRRAADEVGGATGAVLDDAAEMWRGYEMNITDGDIAALRAELEQARDDADYHRARATWQEIVIREARQERDAAGAQNAVLREALLRVKSWMFLPSTDPADPMNDPIQADHDLVNAA